MVETNKTSKILIVDDEESITELLLRFLRGYEVKTSNNPTEVPRLLTDFAPDLIITDFRMPGKTGLEMMEEINSNRTPPIGFYITTGTSFQLPSIFPAGHQGNFQKPFISSELAAEVTKYLGNH